MVLRQMLIQLASYGLSDLGLVRKNNEDVWGSLPQYHLWILADGMGGHQAGEVAARETSLFLLTYIRQAFEKEKIELMTVEEVKELIRLAIIEVNHFVYQLSHTHELLRGMGTTLVLVYFHEDSCIVGHVGDSRVYRQRAGKLEQLTTDHSLVKQLLEQGKKSLWHAEEASVKNVITRAIGTEPFVEPSVESAKVMEDDLYLLCSDGLTDLVASDEISRILEANLTVEEKVRSLISSAKRKGGHDNITAVCIEVQQIDDKDFN
ncbi:MAG: Stp1/IreP family PP2C-type Ser/Thr phosphatase [Verrucomicrobia bacterium]|nr:Stp1/IreP family PP2C-type Ser/Thr phosphatase [Verrucomicrobiota bacterium]MBS0636530.1 Stp1/IreP family PP2C-type Ser/Thr phosphatase [Verrucomicrobiota bacterium]